MTKSVKTYNRYSICFKEKVVQDVSEGSSISEVSRRYGIKGGATVQSRLKKFGRTELLNKVVRIEMKGEQDRLKQLEKELKTTKIALAEKTMALDAMEALVEIANRHYNTDLKKISDANRHSINSLSIYFGYTRDGYYKSLAYSGKESLGTEMLISSAIEIRKNHPRMGGKKMYYLLGDLSKSLHIGRDKFYDILRESDMLVKRKKSGIHTTNSYHRFHVYKNELIKVTLTGSHQAWCSDITYLRTEEGFKYLFLLTDAYSRKIVGWKLSGSLSLEGGIKALKKAIKQCNNPEGLIHHSDRGIQYCSNEYTNLLRKHKINISMTEENHCYENAMAERVNGILKDEYLLDSTFKDFSMAKKACSEAIDLYNTKRPHWALGLKTPEEVHQRVA